MAQGLPSSWKSFCKGKRASGVFPSFAYFPWSVSLWTLQSPSNQKLLRCPYL